MLPKVCNKEKGTSAHISPSKSCICVDTKQFFLKDDGTVPWKKVTDNRRREDYYDSENALS